MFKKKLKVLITLFVSLALMCTMTFATDDSAENAAQNENVVVAEPAENTETATEADEEPTDSSEEATGNDATGATVPGQDAQQAAETKNGDIYQTGDDITISEAVNGNVFITANNLTVTGQIGGDLFVVAKKINLDGAQIYGNVFALADEITINGLIYDLYAACNTLNIPYNGTVYRDLKVVCQNATINGVVGGSVNMTVSGNLTLENDCIIYKDLNYTSPTEIEIKEGAVQGSVNHNTLNQAPKFEIKTSDYVWAIVYSLIFTLIVWLILSFIAPKFTEKVELAGKNRPIASILFGLLTLIAAPIVGLLLIVTIVGIPATIILFTLYCIALAISMPIAIISIASMIAKKVSVLAKARNLCAIVLVAVVIELIKLIPVVGALISFVLLLYGLGIIVLSIFNKVEKKNKKGKRVENKKEPKIEEAKKDEIKKENKDNNETNE